MRSTFRLGRNASWPVQAPIIVVVSARPGGPGRDSPQARSDPARSSWARRLASTAVCRRRLGMPTQPRSYWSNLWDLHERDQALTVAAHLAGRPVASVIFVLGNGHSVLKHSANDAAYRQLCPSHLVVATALELLAEHGIKSMDFGTSSLQK